MDHSCIGLRNECLSGTLSDGAKFNEALMDRFGWMQHLCNAKLALWPDLRSRALLLAALIDSPSICAVISVELAARLKDCLLSSSTAGGASCQWAIIGGASSSTTVSIAHASNRSDVVEDGLDSSVEDVTVLPTGDFYASDVFLPVKGISNPIPSVLPVSEDISDSCNKENEHKSISVHSVFPPIPPPCASIANSEESETSSSTSTSISSSDVNSPSTESETNISIAENSVHNMPSKKNVRTSLTPLSAEKEKIGQNISSVKVQIPRLKKECKLMLKSFCDSVIGGLNTLVKIAGVEDR